ncbi:MAG: nickel pincer cofactor biosynthesis protein LarC [Ignavibacteria bacterium]|nr:nickel pincer cofactor biosynthesis protein LarC [Ignavibacteria bacterium]
MKIAYFDIIGGMSGDMTLGAFVSAGIPIEVLSNEIKKLNLDGIELEASHIIRSGIVAVKIDVVISVHQEHRRHLKDIFKTIDNGSLSGRVKENAKKIFMEVAKAEAKVHNTSIENIHFHEVGALDSIVDIVGAAACFDLLGIESVYSSPVKLGSGGFIDTEHGKLPLPGPATSQILKEYPTILTAIPYELTTPTGAAIIKAMSRGMLSMEEMKVQSIGYGAGTRELPQVPNLLRVMISELLPAYEQDEVVILETNIDDMNPEIYPFVIDQLLATGAHDAYLVPIIMKKGRPGILLSVMTDRSKLDDILMLLFTQTSTLGVRILPAWRRKVQRTQREVTTTLGRVKMKVAVLDGKEKLVPEFEECKRLALEKRIPLIEVYKIIEKEVWG